MKDLFNLYQKLKKMIEKESSVIADNDFEKLREEVEKKNKLINKINEIEIDSYFHTVAADLNEKQLQEKKDDLYKTIEKIGQLQSENIKLLEEKKIENKEKMLSLYNREKSIKGYINSDKYEAKFFDEKS